MADGKPNYAWPPAPRSVIGTRLSRVDGPDKVTGRAKYCSDPASKGLLFGRVLGSPHAHCRVKSIDTSAAEKLPGVKAVKVLQEPGKEIHWAGDDIVAVAAVTDEIARDALRAIKVDYEVLPHMVSDGEPPKDVPPATGPMSMDDLVEMFENQVPDPEIIKTLQADGINFEPDEGMIKMMRDNEVTEPVIKALQAAPRKPGQSRPKVSYKRAAAQTTGEPDPAFGDPNAVISEGMYGASVITHCCLESHGATVGWTDKEHLDVQVSTQNVSGIASQMAQPMKIPAANIHVHQEHIGGGFGSKFSPDRWTIAAAELSKMAGGAPVKLFLDRDRELEMAGARPSAFARVKMAATKDGKITAWQSDSWGTGGPGGGGMPPIPYVFDVPNQRKQHTAIATNQGPARAWRAPNHPQAAMLTMCPLEDLAAKLNMDPLDLFLKNLDITGPRAKTYREELMKADQLMGWKKRWHPRGQGGSGVIKQGLGLSLHTWGGRGHASECDLSIYPDGSVNIKMGTQDLGTGTRTAIMMVAADTLGIKPQDVKLEYGDTRYPPSGGSGGSTTIGGVSSSTRRAAVDARQALFDRVAPALGSTADQLEARDGSIRVKGGGKSLAWKQACAKIGATPISVHGKNPDKERPPDLTNSGVGGVQMADVSVDTETGIVKVNRMVAVQDCGLIINLKTAESQCHGALIMGISYALYEEKITDPVTGLMLNADMEFYRLAGYGDIPELVVHMMTGPGYDERGVIGLGEPPVVSPGAAISNAVANAIGVRVPDIPITPDRVLAALAGAQKARA